DDRLRGKGLQQRDFFGAERIRLVSIDGDGSDRLALAPHRRDEYRAAPTLPGALLDANVEVVGEPFRVTNVDRLPRGYCDGRRRSAIGEADAKSVEIFLEANSVHELQLIIDSLPD